MKSNYLESPRTLPRVLQEYLDQKMVLLKTTQAAIALNVKEQTMRKWACYGGGPPGLIPVRPTPGCLRWRLDDVIRVVLGAPLMESASFPTDSREPELVRLALRAPAQSCPPSPKKNANV